MGHLGYFWLIYQHSFFVLRVPCPCFSLINQYFYKKLDHYIQIPNIYLGLGFEFGRQRIRDLAIMCPLSVHGNKLLEAKENIFQLLWLSRNRVCVCICVQSFNEFIKRFHQSQIPNLRIIFFLNFFFNQQFEKNTIKPVKRLFSFFNCSNWEKIVQKNSWKHVMNLLFVEEEWWYILKCYIFTIFLIWRN